ncbi:CatB-related O-acetyltransferase [Enterococcus sp. BWT-B8]|uniref:CatB-related O-acetyltransferase n=1 Tax=Enterococcus sp. BWT-B8 TaxID=2885157 RepID=UPI001E3042F5|nr:CatB-related O-acetyltransferase [Enterococcus sp. BWT-B8]MCB5951536.1 CatB-related O-acetyltransferase [Enterococcus sp. BWT-B8]
MFVKYVLLKIQLVIFKKKWRKLNRHNRTIAGNIFNPNLVSVGNFTYGTLSVVDFKEENTGLKIGNFCSIAKGVEFLLGGEHDYKNISTYPFKRFLVDDFTTVESFSRGPIIIEDDVWLGRNVLVLSGVTIGQGAIVGAGSIVRKSIPPYSIYIGDRVVKKRFTENTCKKLEKLNWNRVEKGEILSNLDSIYNFKEDHIERNFFTKYIEE